MCVEKVSNRREEQKELSHYNRQNHQSYEDKIEYPKKAPSASQIHKYQNKEIENQRSKKDGSNN
jgi:hypothetical protein